MNPPLRSESFNCTIILIEILFTEMKQLMDECSCDSACQNCLKHYRNQYVQGLLDRYYGLNLLIRVNNLSCYAHPSESHW